jgi:hypothetical protein
MQLPSITHLPDPDSRDLIITFLHAMDARQAMDSGNVTAFRE